jgi:hypothetical protein
MVRIKTCFASNIVPFSKVSHQNKRKPMANKDDTIYKVGENKKLETGFASVAIALTNNPIKIPQMTVRLNEKKAVK